VAIIPTGTELKPIGAEVNVGDIIEFNSVVLASQVKEWGGNPTRGAIVEDDFEKIKDKVIEVSVDHDLIMLIAGSSAGSEDYSSKVVESIGTLLVHGVAVRPGHPVILGMVEAISSRGDREGDKKNLPIIGVPGYPVSATLTGEIFLEPLLALWTGRRPFQPIILPANLTRKTTSPAGDDDYVRVAVGKVGEKILATPLMRGAGVISSLVRADGIVIFPRGSQGLQSGAKVNVRLYRSPEEIDQTILAIGSHDMTLDIWAQYLAAHNSRLTSANVGSLGGLIALQRGETHIAGSHLLDMESGEYNLAYIPKYLPGLPVTVVAFVGRQQGLLLRRGNTKGIRSLQDLTRNDIIFVNRQRGSGTRILLDYHLAQLGISSMEIQGYKQEEYTHLTVAAAVASGRADCGLGIAAAAKALELDFIPLFQERYDIIIPREYYNSSLIAPLLGVLQKDDFRKAVEKLPGYDVTLMGKIIANLE
jgi:putative molybdopterin biosynthesis protein